MSGEVLVRADLAAALPGGLPAMVALHDEMSGLSYWGAWMAGRPLRPRALIPLPGPSGLNAAGLLVRLAESRGLPLMEGEVPSWLPEYDVEDGWQIQAEGGEARQLVVCDATYHRMHALRRLVHHVGRLYAVARAVGLEPATGEWPRFGRDGVAWVIGADGGQQAAFVFDVECLGDWEGLNKPVLALTRTMSPYEALKIVHAEVCP